MRVKELNNKLAHVCWSPYTIYPSYIASGTAAEQQDSSTGTNSVLELLRFDLSNPSTELDVAGTIQTESRFSKLKWSEESSGSSLLIGGCENSKIYLYDYETILSNNSSSAVIKTLDNHTGCVQALDVNPFQTNLLASGAGSSEILIWDLNNSNEPMTPGAKIQPLDDINCLAWNRQVQHILASTCSGKCVVWDLRKNESIIKVSDNMSKMKARQVAWHPEIATQMCLSSDDDNSPFLQIWDLRFATSPVRVLEGHQRGILNFTWCSVDSNLLVSSAKDNRIICWDPNNATTNGEILYDLPTSGQWCFDVSWSQRNPNLICASSFEGMINVYSLMGGKYNVIHQTSSKIMDSFGVDSSIKQDTPLEVQQQVTQTISPLKIAPKWMKRLCGASFGFGGKLVQFGKIVSEDPQIDKVANQRITISQVVTDSELVEKAQYLESILKTGNLNEYCNYKIEIADTDNESLIWKFIMATLYADKNKKFMELLGFNKTQLEENLNTLSLNDDEHNSIEPEFAAVNGQSNQNFFDQINFNTQQEEQEDHQLQPNSTSPINFSFTDEVDEEIGKSLILGNYKKVVDLCIKENRWTEAVLVASFFDPKLFEKTQRKFFKTNEKQISKLLEGVLNKDWSNLVSLCNLNDWKQVLATIMTYPTPAESSTLCDTLGMRLEKATHLEAHLLNACICYICSSNLDNLVGCWEKLNNEKDIQQDPSVVLQDLIEKVMTLRFSLKNVNGDAGLQKQNETGSRRLNAKMAEYAKLLTDQGCFLNAYNYINDYTDPSILVLKNRIYQVLDPHVIQQNRLSKPEYPFQATTQANLQRKLSNVSRANSYNNNNSLHTPLAQRPSYSSPQSTTPNLVNPSPRPSNTPNTIQNNYSSPMPVQIQQPQQTPSTTNSGLFTPSIPQSAAQNNVPTMPSYMHTRAPTGWNDPPMIAPKIKPPPSASNPTEIPSFFQPAPMTSSQPPINNYQGQHQLSYQQQPNQMFQPQVNSQQTQAFQPNLPQQSFRPPNLGPSQPTQVFQPSLPQQSFQASNLGQNQPTQVFQPSLPQQNFQPQQQYQQQSRPASVLQERVEVVEKGPIPNEYQNIKNTFDTLLKKCISATSAPVARRKLEDAGKKLEILYDKLRDSSLSENVIEGLNSMISHAQISDFPATLNLHSQVVARSNFSEISGFMPGIKVLIQSCQQLGAHFN